MHAKLVNCDYIGRSATVLQDVAVQLDVWQAVVCCTCAEHHPRRVRRRPVLPRSVARGYRQALQLWWPRCLDAYRCRARRHGLRQSLRRFSIHLLARRISRRLCMTNFIAYLWKQLPNISAAIACTIEDYDMYCVTTSNILRIYVSSVCLRHAWDRRDYVARSV